jgi:prevent-host-death family protein
MDTELDTVTIHVAKTNLSQLLARVEGGEEIIVARGKQPIAKLVPFKPVPSKRQAGSMRGLITFDESFFDPLPPEELAGWE